MHPPCTCHAPAKHTRCTHATQPWLQEVVGSAIAITLLSQGAVPVWAGCIITGCDTFTFLAVHYFGVRYLEVLVAALIAVMSACFCVNWATSWPHSPDEDGRSSSLELLRGWVVPSMVGYATTSAVGTIGAVIMPHPMGQRGCSPM